MSENIRIRTTPNGNDNYLNVKLEQNFDFIEILSLKISQDKVYENFCSDYGVIVGRVIVNNGFGVPNAKVSVFIPISEDDKKNPQISGLYPYETVNDVDSDGIRYNLLPKEVGSQDDCYTPVGTFPLKREILDNDEMLEIYCKYYKFTTVTNYAGDFMIFGVPLGSHIVHVDADISDIGIASQRPYDLIDQGAPIKMFESSTKFKTSKNINTLTQIKTNNIGVNVQPFWGDQDSCVIGINRLDVNLNYDIRPSAIFTGSIFGDSRKNSVNKNCRPRKNLGKLCEQITREGTIEMIRKTIDGDIERFDIDGGRVIDQYGAWAYQVPMNLDYKITDEFGQLVPSDNIFRGIPTRARVRFKVSMDEGGGTGRLRTRAKYLIPHNPNTIKDLDFNFDKTTKDSSFTNLYWNKIYTVKNYIAKVKKRSSGNYIGIKDVDGCVGDKNPFPYNRASTSGNILFTITCFIFNIFAAFVFAINKIICFLRRINIFGFRPFKNLRPIGLECPSDPIRTFYPGCNDSIQSYTDCVSAVLADQLGLFEFNFYNDWINGSLYFYLLKYKKKRRGNEKFCETYCNETIIPSVTTSNYCKTMEISDSTFSYPFIITSENFRNGLMVKYNKELYYPPIVLNGKSLKLYATDVISLGPVFNCDWQGYPKIINYLTNTSYELPPLVQEDAEDQGDTIVSGMIQLGRSANGLFFDIGCGGVSYDSRQATNIRRQCELQVDIPEVDTLPSANNISIYQIYDPSDPIDTATSINRYIRDVFTLTNIYGALPVYPSQTLTDKTLGTSFGINATKRSPNHTSGKLYSDFRNYYKPYSNAAPDIALQSWGNSYYMYFGIIPGNTAIDKLNSKYFTSCDRIVTNDFIIETNVTNVSSIGAIDGIIAFTFIGGTAPFRYTITNNTTFTVSSTATLNGVQNGLAAGTYTITATDALGSIVIKEIIIDNPQTLNCTFAIGNEPWTLQSTNGTIDIYQISGGRLPYKLVVSGPVPSTILNVSIFDSPISGLSAGLYTLTVTDSSNPVQICSKQIELTPPPPLTITFGNDGITDADCGCNGTLSPTITGGVAPYTAIITCDSVASYPDTANFYFSGLTNSSVVIYELCPTTYTIKAIDTVGTIVTIRKTLNGPSSPLKINATRNGDVITYSATGGTPPYRFTPSGSQLLGSNTYISAEPVTIEVIDNSNCQDQKTV